MPTFRSQKAEQLAKGMKRKGQGGGRENGRALTWKSRGGGYEKGLWSLHTSKYQQRSGLSTVWKWKSVEHKVCKHKLWNQMHLNPGHDTAVS